MKTKNKLWKKLYSFKSKYFSDSDSDNLPIQGPNPGHKIEDTSDCKAAQNEELLSQQCLLFE